jgi:hypothetical protein
MRSTTGSNLGPLLFLSYINDISNSSNILSYRLFADDTNLLMEGKNLTDLTKDMNTELHNFSEWENIKR